MKTHFITLAFCVAFSISSFAQQAAPNIVFILDGSGSMWQKVENEFKIAAAKSVLKQLVNNLPNQTQAGLVVYGHRQKSDCNDIESVIPLQPLDKKTFAGKLDQLNPTGKTPIALSIQHTLGLIKSVQEDVTIVLVTDGLETCEGDACGLIKAAKTQGVNITTHVIGFGIAEKDLSALECIAQAGGGQYLPADNAAQLKDALQKSVEEIPEGGGYLSLKATAEQQLLDVTVEVFDPGTQKRIAFGRTYNHAGTNPRKLLLPAGNYYVKVKALPIDGTPVVTLNDLRITEGDTLFKEVDFSSGELQVLVTCNEDLHDATVRIYKAGTKELVTQTRSYETARSNPAKFEILPGTYDIVVESVKINGGAQQIFANKTVLSGKDLNLSHNFQSGEIAIGVKGPNGLVDAVVALKDSDGKAAGQGRTYMSDSSNPKTFLMTPGVYTVEIKPVKPAGLSKKNVKVEVTAKEKKIEWINY